MLKLYDIVKYKDEFPDEAGTRYMIIEIDVAKNWALIIAKVDAQFRPTYTANLSDLEIA